jgi:hypothetical protein
VASTGEPWLNRFSHQIFLLHKHQDADQTSFSGSGQMKLSGGRKRHGLSGQGKKVLKFIPVMGYTLH